MKNVFESMMKLYDTLQLCDNCISVRFTVYFYYSPIVVSFHFIFCSYSDSLIARINATLYWLKKKHEQRGKKLYQQKRQSKTSVKMHIYFWNTYFIFQKTKQNKTNRTNDFNLIIGIFFPFSIIFLVLNCSFSYCVYHNRC